MTLTTKILVGALLVVATLLGVQTWRVKASRRDAAEAAVAPAKQQAKLAAAKVETVTVHLAAAERVVTRTLMQVRTDTLMLRPQTAHDTATALAEFPALAIAHDSLQRSCRAFVVSCGEYRAAAEQRFRADSGVIAVQDQLLKDRPPRRHWTPCLSVGYGGMVAGGLVRTGASVTAGLCWTPF